jgi:hypothetical protein
VTPLVWLWLGPNVLDFSGAAATTILLRPVESDCGQLVMQHRRSTNSLVDITNIMLNMNGFGQNAVPVAKEMAG